MARRLGWSGLLVLLGLWPLSTAWSGRLALVVFAIVAVGVLLVVVAGTRLRLPAPLVATVLVLAGLAAGARWTVPAGVGPAQGLRDSVARLLTEVRPAPATPQLLAPGILLVVAVSLWVALRALRPHRAGAGLVAAPVGAVVLYAAAALLTAGRADPGGLAAGAIVVVTVAGWVRIDPVRLPGRAALARLVPSVAVVAVAVMAGFWLLAAPGFEPRRLVDPPSRTVAEPSPLPRIAAWQQDANVELLRASVDLGAPLRLVVLSDYTGETWSATATYRRPGSAPDNHLPVAHETTVLARVSISTLDGPWLPTPGRATSTSLSDVDIESDAGSLAIRSGALRPGLTYSVRAVLDTPRIDEVAAAAVPSGSSVRRLLDLPRLPRIFADYARQVTFGASTPFEQAVAIEDAVRSGGRMDATAPSGSSYARLETFLFRQSGAEPGAHAGTSEQFAGAFAVLARAVGLPTRIVVGFASGTPGPDGIQVMHGRDVLAWPEIYFAGLGWYGFDPTPTGVTGSDQRAKLDVLDRMGTQAGRANPTAPVAAGSVTTAAPSAQRPPGTGSGSGRLAITVAGAGVVTAAVLLAALMSARLARRSRHRRAGDRGAWSEVVDLLVLLGRPPQPWWPAPAVATELAGLAPIAGPGPHPAQVIAYAADRAAFAPAAPPAPAAGVARAASGAPAASAAPAVLGAAVVAEAPAASGLGRGSDAPDAWSVLGDLRRAVRATVPWWRRLSWPIDPRPLVRGNQWHARRWHARRWHVRRRRANTGR